jgi:hypothetical protein
MCVNIERVGWLSKRDGWFVIEKWMAPHEESWVAKYKEGCIRDRFGRMQVERDQWKERDGCYRWLNTEIAV